MRRPKATLGLRRVAVDCQRPYYAMHEEPREEVLMTLTGEDGVLRLVRGRIVDRAKRTYRNRQVLRIVQPRTRVDEELYRIGGRSAKALRLRLFGGYSTERIARRLGVGVDTVRRGLADATLRLGVACELPELNAWNLVPEE
jgi:predicted DNA-binding protein (UPF0251 family)